MSKFRSSCAYVKVMCYGEGHSVDAWVSPLSVWASRCGALQQWCSTWAPVPLQKSLARSWAYRTERVMLCKKLGCRRQAGRLLLLCWTNTLRKHPYSQERAIKYWMVCVTVWRALKLCRRQEPVYHQQTFLSKHKKWRLRMQSTKAFEQASINFKLNG